MKKASQRVVNLIIIVIFVGIIGLGVYNSITNHLFWSASATSCLSLMVAIGLSYLLVQKQTDRRKQKDILLNLLASIQVTVTDSSAYRIDENMDPAALTMRTRDISNRLGILTKWKDNFEIDADVDFINEKFCEYEALIGDHISNLKYLRQSEKELRRPLDLINQRIVDVMLKLYQ